MLDGCARDPVGGADTDAAAKLQQRPQRYEVVRSAREPKDGQKGPPGGRVLEPLLAWRLVWNVEVLERLAQIACEGTNVAE